MWTAINWALSVGYIPIKINNIFKTIFLGEKSETKIVIYFSANENSFSYEI